MSVSNSITVRLHLDSRPGVLAAALKAIGDQCGDVGAIDIVRADAEHTVRDVTVDSRDEAHAERIVAALSAVPGVEHSRKLFHAIGQDPTKRRPSSEALLHRALKGKTLNPINTLVDVGNWCSLDVQLPYGLYDASAVRPPAPRKTRRRSARGTIRSGGGYQLLDSGGSPGGCRNATHRVCIVFRQRAAVFSELRRRVRSRAG